MRKAILAALLAALVLLPGAAQAAAGFELPLSGQARVTLVQGDVTVDRDGAATRPAQGQDLAAPVRVSVGLGGRLELLMPEGSVLRFAQGTEFTVVKAVADVRNRNVQVDVTLGNAWATVSEFLGQGENGFSLDSPTAVAGVAGTRYRLSVDPGRGSDYLVYEGRVNVAQRPPEAAGGPGAVGAPHRVPGPSRVAGPHRVSREEWNFIVAQGYRFTVSPRGEHQPPRPFDLDQDGRDPWVRWNMERDALAGR